jgi:hypothetical protein
MNNKKKMKKKNKTLFLKFWLNGGLEKKQMIIFTLYCLCFCFVLFSETESHYAAPGWPPTLSPPASTSLVLGSWVSTTIPGLTFLLLMGQTEIVQCILRNFLVSLMRKNFLKSGREPKSFVD